MGVDGIPIGAGDFISFAAACPAQLQHILLYCGRPGTALSPRTVLQICTAALLRPCQRPAGMQRQVDHGYGPVIGVGRHWICGAAGSEPVNRRGYCLQTFDRMGQGHPPFTSPTSLTGTPGGFLTETTMPPRADLASSFESTTPGCAYRSANTRACSIRLARSIKDEQDLIYRHSPLCYPFDLPKLHP